MTTRIDRIAAAFARTAESGRSAALIPYIAAGDPSPAATPALMHALVEAGADIIELGVPFSDPMADGPVIQRAADRAIAQGVGLTRVLELVAEFRQTDTTTPVVLMGYANPIERMGQSEFASNAERAGVDGVLVVDYPPEEVIEFASTLGAHGIAPIFLLAPTSTEARIQSVAKVARGYVYYVSLKGVTGAGSLNTDDVAERVAVIRRHMGDIPVGVGFGIRDAQSAQRVARVADAVVIGSKLIETMEQAVADAPAAQQTNAAVTAASGWLRTIRHALDQVKRDDASA
ncbi:MULTISPECIES: tryptophan synthase subunit alpha [Achromobacter]|uniref:Tryptophan synthase alpha chain n=2 Tax=Achromobacter piechaudii TaxID=72556 RepID=A0A6S7EFH3_9BURK|nr:MULTISPECIES: tryptophan synthase subunit alpha [Achromobacter]EFF76659.1 tryptophan synthase, alpha subunit [Achromobacter piechaudii ATCC 43553]MPS78936.1 tryptophan synthase subunit alpha [Achromobacter sp.]CAB3716908.1 Tryptophan synthase alpha chain [Achromobacter piechaudii]CAB3884586.1 Tryptophan synthase alpha chain [Achromobacter piechaudii]CAB3907160.1 Tryptophan synthase alpha chain [Achromobacter piechaudii]